MTPSPMVQISGWMTYPYAPPWLGLEKGTWKKLTGWSTRQLGTKKKTLILAQSLLILSGKKIFE
jgi:hypothetical protein